jgi:uncharacterized protein (TIGR04255 family)
LANSTTLDYLHPPVTEAVIQVRVKHEMTIEDMEKVTSKLRKTYPHKIVLNDYDIRISKQPIVGESVAVNQQPKRLQISSDDQIDRAIIGNNALTVARLAPYPGWDIFYEKFIHAWKSWKKVANTKSISRIGVRYINRIDIPLMGEDKIELEDYLTFYPKVPELDDSPIVEYLIQVTKPINNLWTATIISTLLQSPLINHISLLLDIDVFRTEQIPLKDEDLWAVITEARNIKNTVFQRCLTQKTRDLFS